MGCFFIPFLFAFNVVFIKVFLFTYFSMNSSRKDPRQRDPEYFLEHLKFFINLYQRNDLEVSGETYSNFQEFLDIYDTSENETFYNTRKVAELVSIQIKESTQNM